MGGLNFNTDERALEDHFSSFGPISEGEKWARCVMGGIVEESLGPMHFRKQERKVRTLGLTVFLSLFLGLRLRTQ